jgi:sulfite reductase alpha subunit-like flavoprotein
MYVKIYPVNSSISGNILYFGCRKKDKDFFCKDEWTRLVNKGLLNLITAFSRDQVIVCYNNKARPLW